MALDLKKIPAGVTLAWEEIDRIDARASELLNAFQRRIAGLQKSVDDARESYAREADDMVASTGPENRATAKAFTKAQLASRILKYRLNIVASSRDQRHELLDPLAAFAQQAAFLMELFASPAQALGRVGLGTAQRTNYQEQLTGAGPVELQSYAAQAITANDAVLAAAIVTVVDRMPRDRRPFAVSEFAEQMWGDKHRAAMVKLKTVVRANKLAQIANSTFETGRANPAAKLSATLDQRDIDRLTAGA
jgi:hypothetical protein